MLLMILNGLNCFPFLFCLLCLTSKSPTRNHKAYYKTHAPLRLYETTKLLLTPMATLLLYPKDTCCNISMLPFSLSFEMEQKPNHYKLACCQNAPKPSSKCIQCARVCYLAPKTKWGHFQV